MDSFRNFTTEDGFRGDIVLSSTVGLLGNIFSGRMASIVSLKDRDTFSPFLPVNFPSTLEYVFSESAAESSSILSGANIKDVSTEKILVGLCFFV